MNLDAIEAFTIDLAKEAGTLIKHARQQGQVERAYKGQHELVTSADLAADKLVVETIQSAYPNHRILSEETFSDPCLVKDLDNPLWIIDPIDGTVNFAHGQMMVAVSIAFAYQGEIKVGVVHNPFLEETFVAAKDKGASLNGETIKVSGETELRKSLIATGFPYDKSTLAPIIKRIDTVLHACQDIRRLGSAALDICWVACGRLDGYFESLSPWDFAAARLIALEAGATCGHFSVRPKDIPECIYNLDILITTPAIYSDLERLLSFSP